MKIKILWYVLVVFFVVALLSCTEEKLADVIDEAGDEVSDTGGDTGGDTNVGGDTGGDTGDDEGYENLDTYCSQVRKILESFEGLPGVSMDDLIEEELEKYMSTQELTDAQVRYIRACLDI